MYFTTRLRSDWINFCAIVFVQRESERVHKHLYSIYIIQFHNLSTMTTLPHEQDGFHFSPFYTIFDPHHPLHPTHIDKSYLQMGFKHPEPKNKKKERKPPQRERERSCTNQQANAYSRRDFTNSAICFTLFFSPG